MDLHGEQVPGFEPQLGLGVTLPSKNGVRVRIESDDSAGHKSQ